MPSDLPANISSYGADIDGVINLIYWITGIWLLATEAAVVYFVIRYRKRDGVRAAWMPAKTLKACMWVLVPVVAVIVCDMVIEVASTDVWARIKEEVPPHDLEVRITGRQFAWSFTYPGRDGKFGTPDDFETVGEMHVPRDKVVRFQLESVDVLHAFWVPVLRLKQDVVPGRSIPGWFEATKEGRYEIACAEICGPGHTSMRALLFVDSPEAFDAWHNAKMDQQQSLRADHQEVQR